MIERDYSPFELGQPFDLIVNPQGNKADFIKLAKSRIIFQTRSENRSLVKKYVGIDKETPAQCVVLVDNDIINGRARRRWIKGFQILINRELFEDASRHFNEDFTKLIDYVLEHEIYESWLMVKNGIGQNLNGDEMHWLAKRREFYLAEKDGFGDKLFDFYMWCSPEREEEYKNALNYAKGKLLGNN